MAQGGRQGVRRLGLWRRGSVSVQDLLWVVIAGVREELLREHIQYTKPTLEISFTLSRLEDTLLGLGVRDLHHRVPSLSCLSVALQYTLHSI